MVGGWGGRERPPAWDCPWGLTGPLLQGQQGTSKVCPPRETVSVENSDCEVFGVKTPSSGSFMYSSAMSPAAQRWRLSLSPPKVIVWQ